MEAIVRPKIFGGDERNLLFIVPVALQSHENSIRTLPDAGRHDLRRLESAC